MVSYLSDWKVLGSNARLLLVQMTIVAKPNYDRDVCSCQLGR